MKRIYFVRHGESTDNVSGVVQGTTSTLTENGRAQAHFLAKRVADLKIEAIIASPVLRAKQTAEIISAQLRKEIVFNDAFAERRNSSELIGAANEKDPAVAKISLTSLLRHDKGVDWKHSDEENFSDLKQRCFEGLRFLENSPHEHLLVVSHGLYLRALVGTILFGEDFTPREMHHLLYGLMTRNTGITVAVFDAKDTFSAGGWRLLTWNDHAHLPH